jgi:hypothetical protein
VRPHSRQTFMCRAEYIEHTFASQVLGQPSEGRYSPIVARALSLIR